MPTPLWPQGWHVVLRELCRCCAMCPPAPLPPAPCSAPIEPKHPPCAQALLSAATAPACTDIVSNKLYFGYGVLLGCVGAAEGRAPGLPRSYGLGKGWAGPAGHRGGPTMAQGVLPWHGGSHQGWLNAEPGAGACSAQPQVLAVDMPAVTARAADGDNQFGGGGQVPPTIPLHLVPGWDAESGPAAGLGQRLLLILQPPHRFPAQPQPRHILASSHWRGAGRTSGKHLDPAGAGGAGDQPGKELFL